MFRKASLVLVVLIGSFASRVVSADSILFGSPGNSSLSAPFGQGSSAGNDSTRYDQAYSADVFKNALLHTIRIETISFFSTPQLGSGGSFSGGTYDLYLGTTTTAVNQLSSSDFDGNFTTPPVFFASITFNPGDTLPSEIDIAGAKFDYNATMGNLLLDVRVRSQTAGDPTGFLDAQINSTDFGSAQNFGDPLADAGLVTQFGFTPVPEPSSLGLLVLGGGASAVGVALRRRRDRI